MLKSIDQRIEINKEDVQSMNRINGWEIEIITKDGKRYYTISHTQTEDKYVLKTYYTQISISLSEVKSFHINKYSYKEAVIRYFWQFNSNRSRFDVQFKFNKTKNID